MRRATDENPGRVILFRMRRYDGVLWQRPVIEEGQLGTPQFVVPNVPHKLGSWLTGDVASDFNFIRGTIQLQGEPVWDPRVICTTRPLD